MDKSEFKRYLETKQKLSKEFKNIDKLEEKYNEVIENKKKLNEYQKAYHKDMMVNDPDYAMKRKEYNKKSYEKYKEAHPYIPKKQANKVIQPIEKPIDKSVEKLVEKPLEHKKNTLDSFFNTMIGI